MKRNTSKLRAGIAGLVSGISSFIAWLATVPPEQQNALLGPLVETMPLEWRPAIGLVMRILATASTAYAVFQASKSGPATPPKNPVAE